MRFLPVQLILGLVLCTLIPYIVSGWDFIGKYIFQVNTSDFVISGFLVLLTILTLNSIRRFPGISASTYIIPVLFSWFTLILVIVKLAEPEYSLTFYCFSACILLTYLFFIDIINRQKQKYIFAYIPVGRAKQLPNELPSVEWFCLEYPTLDKPVNAIVTDLHSEDLSGEWERFIADQTLKGIPVYHHRNVRESLTGRVKINHLYENDLGSLLPSENYMALKRFIEVALILLSLPLTLPIMLITAILIKVESPGPILFIQQRVGLGGKEFSIYKFRSMSKDSEKDGAKMATEGDMRVTRVGKFIRKTRIDELPQFWNIVKGDMSLIGPRPEQKVFVDQFDESIPFYNYRHIVKPGITGWAQVTHGYAADEDETRVKVEHDFYYIKHFSFSLDLLIFFKTIHTMITGFGAR